MWINPTTQAVYKTHAEIRLGFPGASFPSAISEQDIEFVGLAPIAQLAAPPHSVISQTLTQAAPALVNSVWTQQWIVTDLPAPQAASNLAAAKLAAERKIDADVDALYTTVIGSRAQEYALADAQAAAYIAAGYTGIVPPYVQSWATAKGWTATQAADDIAATATAWKAAQQAIRAARLLRKEQCRTAASEASLSAAIAAWQALLSAIKTQLGVPS